MHTCLHDYLKSLLCFTVVCPVIVVPAPLAATPFLVHFLCSASLCLLLPLVLLWWQLTRSLSLSPCSSLARYVHCVVPTRAIACDGGSLVPRLSVPDFVSQLWRKIDFSPKLRDKIQNGEPGNEAMMVVFQPVYNGHHGNTLVTRCVYPCR